MIDMLVDSPDLFTANTAGNLGANVRRFIKNAGFTITDSGGGFSGCGGHIGIPCTDEESQKLICLVNHNFKKAIMSDMMSVVIAWFKPSFFENDTAAEKYIREHLEGD